MFYIMTFTYIFKVTNFEMRMSRKWSELAKNAQEQLLYLPSNLTISNLVLCTHDLNFHGQTFQVSIWQEMAEKQTLLLQSDRKSDTCHRIVKLRMLYIVTLTYILNVNLSKTVS